MTDFSQPPSTNTLPLSPFEAQISNSDLDNFHALLALSPLPPPTNKNHTFLSALKEEWPRNGGPRKHINKLNAFPNYTTQISGYSIHFTALFSSSSSATNLLLLHNFPASPYQFIPLLHALREEYPTAAELPYNIIAPSLPGYAYSSDVPSDYKISQAATLLDSLMKGLFGNRAAYIVHGGDLGSFIARKLVKPSSAAVAERDQGSGCAAAHVTMMRPPSGPPEHDSILSAGEEGKACLAQMARFQENEGAMLTLLATNPDLIAGMVSASPLALAAWVGHVLCAWAGWTLEHDLDRILEMLTVCWFTGMYSRGLWHSRALSMEGEGVVGTYARITKPVGYSLFRGEIVPVPRVWAEEQCNLVFFREHEAGGHFAAL